MVVDKFGIELQIGDKIITNDGGKVKIGEIKQFHNQYVILS